jgi:hypothetical protein
MFDERHDNVLRDISTLDIPSDLRASFFLPNTTPDSYGPGSLRQKSKLWFSEKIFGGGGGQRRRFETQVGGASHRDIDRVPACAPAAVRCACPGVRISRAYASRRPPKRGARRLPRKRTLAGVAVVAQSTRLDMVRAVAPSGAFCNVKRFRRCERRRDGRQRNNLFSMARDYSVDRLKQAF